MKADPFAQARLLDLQDIDARLDQLAHRRGTLPELTAITRLTAERQELEDRLVLAQTECSDLEREQAKAEADVEQVRARASRDRQRMDSGQVGSARDLENLQHEMTSLARRQAELEDVELEIMERLEAAQAAATALTEQQQQLESELGALIGSRDQAFAEIDREAASHREEREVVAAQVPDDLRALYEKLRVQYGGVGAAALRQRRCGGCRLELNSIELGRIRAAPSDDVLRCEECRRILVRIPESGV